MPLSEASAYLLHCVFKDGAGRRNGVSFMKCMISSSSGYTLYQNLRWEYFQPLADPHKGQVKGQEIPCPFCVCFFFPVGIVPHSEFIHHQRSLNYFTNKAQRAFGFALFHQLQENRRTCIACSLVLNRSELAEWIYTLGGIVPPRVLPRSPRKFFFSPSV